MLNTSGWNSLRFSVLFLRLAADQVKPFQLRFSTFPGYCKIYFIFLTSLILIELNDKYEFIVIMMINHIQLKNNVFKIDSNIDWLYYLILNETKRIDAQSIQKIFMIMTLSSVDFDNFNFKNKSKKNKKKGKKILNKFANKFCELHKINAIHVNKNCFHHNKAHFVFEYEIIVIIDEHTLFSAISADWILESEATKHVCCNKTYFDHLESYNINLKWNFVSRISINDIDSVWFILFNNSFPNSFSAIRLQNVLFVFELNINLLFLNKFQENRYEIHFESNYVKLKKTPPLSTAFIGKTWLFSISNRKQKKHSFWPILTFDMFGWGI